MVAVAGNEPQSLKNARTPQISWLFHKAAGISLKGRIHPCELYDQIKRNFINIGKNSRAASAAIQAVKDAVALIGEAGRLEKLERSLGYSRPTNHHIAVAMSVAVLNLDMTDEAESRENSGKETGLIREKKREKRSAQEKPDSADKVASIIASLLQEFVAYDAISLDEVAEKFGRNSEVYRLTEQLSRITRIPVSIKLPDEEGKLSVREILYNREQENLARELILFSENPARVGLIKIFDALQQLRDLRNIKSLDDATNDLSKKQLAVALHVRGMYLPLVREMGMYEVQTEMEKFLIDIIDPEAAVEILKQRERIASKEKTRAVEKSIMEALKKKGFGIRSVSKIIGGRKSIYSIWNKLLVKILEKAEKGDHNEKIEYSKLQNVDLASIYDCLRFRIILKDSLDLNGDFDQKMNEKRLHSLHDIFCDMYEPVDGRYKDFLGDKRKPNMYQALHNTFLRGFIEYKGKIIPEFMELHFVTEGMEKINNCSHPGHKLNPCRGKNDKSSKTGVHPAEVLPSLPHIRSNMLRNFVERALARIAKYPLPEAVVGNKIIIGDYNGVLAGFPVGISSGDIVKYALAIGGGICDDAGRLIPKNQGMSLKDYHRKVLRELGPDKLETIETETRHAGYLRYLVFSSSANAGIMPAVRLLQKTKPLSCAII